MGDKVLVGLTLMTSALMVIFLSIISGIFIHFKERVPLAFQIVRNMIFTYVTGIIFWVWFVNLASTHYFLDSRVRFFTLPLLFPLVYCISVFLHRKEIIRNNKEK